MKSNGLSSLLWILALAVVYLSLGFVVGYFMGYRDGLEDYRLLVEEITSK